VLRVTLLDSFFCSAGETGHSMSQKERIIERLNQILQIHDINWGLLPEQDLMRLFDGFQRLKQEFEEVFRVSGKPRGRSEGSKNKQSKG